MIYRRPTIPMPPHWTKGQKAWDRLSLYKQMKHSRPIEQQAFGPFKTMEDWRFISRENDKRKCAIYGRRRKPKDAPIYWQLPPEVRAEAAAYEHDLKRKWARRIAVQPQFAAFLHMITIGYFKDKSRKRSAWCAGGNHLHRKYKLQAKLMAGLEGEPRVSPASIHHLDLDLT